MNRRVSLGLAFAMMLLVAAFTFSIATDIAERRVNEKMVSLRERERSQAKYAEIDREVRENYNGVIDETLLLDSVARGYLAGIGDPYATYYDARTYERILRAQNNPTADIGAVLRANPDGYLTVLEVYPDSPAMSANIKEGDLIVKIDEIDLTPENSLVMLEYIQGEQGSRITLTVRSDNIDRIEELTRRVVIVPSVYARMIGDTMTGYILITEFGDHTSDQFNLALRRITGAGARSIIFDVRDNGGGKLSAAARILDRLVPTGMIASSFARDGSISVLYTSDAYEIELPMVVLVNGGTASSAELFAQVLRDYEKARIVGTQTAGKGVMQRIITLTDGSAIEITVAKLVSPRGEIFDDSGIRPDYDISIDGNWQGLDETLDPQLKKALEVAVASHRTSDPPAQQEAPPAEESRAPQQNGMPSAGSG